MMTRLLLTRWRGSYDEIVVLFANTGEENKQTLEFVHECDQAFDFRSVWIKAVVHHGTRKSSSHKVVTFETASRSGEPFERMIQKYGIPNQKFPHCTRELKLRPMLSYIASLGWEPGTFDTAIGIRADEARRRSPAATEDRLVYPLLDWLPTTKPQVNSFWEAQPFRLRLPGYKGNCRTCWKKSIRKLMTIMDDDPSVFDFTERMEGQYATVGAEFKKQLAPGYRRVFYRGNLSTGDLRTIYREQFDAMDRAENDAIVYAGHSVPLDLEPGDGCTESCEIDFDPTSGVRRRRAPSTVSADLDPELAYLLS